MRPADTSAPAPDARGVAWWAEYADDCARSARKDGRRREADRFTTLAGALRALAARATPRPAPAGEVG